MDVTRAEVLKIAELAKLHFSESELEAFIAQFQHILEYIEKLKGVDIAGVEPTSHAAHSDDPGGRLLRADAIRPPLSVSEALRNAPDQGDEHFRVPKVI